VNDAKVLDRLAAEQAQLILGAKTCAAHRNGDRRRRPVFYVERAQAVRLLRSGHLTAGAGETLLLSPDYKRPRYVPPPKLQRKMPLQHLRKSRAGRAPYLTAQEVRAGERFAADYARAHQGKAASQRFEASGVFTAKSSAGQEAAMAARLDASARLRAARNFTSPQLALILEAVLGQDIPLADFETRHNWAKGSAKPVFKKALAELAAHYKGISQPPRP